MKKVITYGTYDLLHYGHIRLLERAKALGDYLIVGVTADDFDKARGKINVQQSLMERVEAVRATGLADEIIVEEYEGQKIDDIRRLGVDIFTVGSDWKGKFDYLSEYCSVVYLERTEGVSSSDLRSSRQGLKLGLIGSGNILRKYWKECAYVNGIDVVGVCSKDAGCIQMAEEEDVPLFESAEELVEQVEAVYIIEPPRKQERLIEVALKAEKHVLCEAPVSLSRKGLDGLYKLADRQNVVLMEGIKTAYATAFNRLQLLLKSGCIGKVVAVDATCTSMRDIGDGMGKSLHDAWNSMYAWGPTALLPVFQLLGTDFIDCRIISSFADNEKKYDQFSKIDLVYPGAVATVKVGQGVKSEGDLVISGTKGYAYVPAPWWKTDYFEIRYENPADNKRYFYPLDGEGIRYELVAFVNSITTGKNMLYVTKKEAEAISGIMEQFEHRDLIELKNR